MSGQPTEIYSAANTQQAYLLKSLLEERGIAAWVVNDAIQLAGGELPLGWTAAARVVVGENDAEEARRFVEDFDSTTAHEPVAEDASEVEPLEWSAWPLCIQCGERRSARCPVCGVSGTRFPLADIQETEDGQRALLVCEACDDHFVPEWYRLCPRCGHDFGDGLEVGTRPERSQWSLQTWLVLGAMTAGALAFAAYWIWLFGWQTV